ncbi:hypothetical protein JCM8547_007959 [Rhodosporidiobolus lusitaniae]
MSAPVYIPLTQHPYTGSYRLQRRSSSPHPLPSLDCSAFARTLPQPKTALALVLTLFLLIALVFSRPSRTERELKLLAEGEDPNASFASLYSPDAWEPYEEEGQRVEGGEGGLASWAEKLSNACAEQLVSEGKLCSELDGAFLDTHVDLLWTWTNGSDPLLRRWRAEVTASLSGKVKSGKAAIRQRLTAHHFRDHDELRFSIRSALHAFSSSALRQLHLLTTDLLSNVLFIDLLELSPNITTIVDLPRIGQVPRWLNPSSAFQVTHHSSFFQDETALPTFNSLSIESQLPNMPMSEFLLYLNDDSFLFSNGSMTASDIGAPLLGPVLRIQTDLTVDGVAPSDFAGSKDGEWSSLRHANYLLDRRFGKRSRGYLAHIPKALSTPLLREVGQIWHAELLETSFSRFRGQRIEYQLAFLATHYLIEAHREALLHAFVVARSDRNFDGVLSLAEREELLVELSFDLPVSSSLSPETLRIPFPRRRTRADLPLLLRRAGLPQPGATGVAFSSMDGFGLGSIRGDKPKELLRPVLHLDEADQPADETEEEKAAEGRIACTIDYERCFGADFLDPGKKIEAAALLRRIAQEDPECGDCAIVALVGKSGTQGLSAFLPSCTESSPSSSPASESSPIPPSALFSLSKTSSTSALARSFPSSSPPTCPFARSLAIRRILRYSYILGDSTSRFIGMQNGRVMEIAFKKIKDRQGRGEQLPTFLTLNDDFKSDTASASAQPILEKFFNEQWPDPSPYEKQADDKGEKTKG